MNLPLSEKVNMLHKAAIRGDIETLSKLLSDGCSTELRDINGNTPLHMSGHSFIITCLIANGCDLFARNKNNDLAIDIMRRKGVHKDVIDYLKEEMIMFAENRGVFKRLKSFLLVDVYAELGAYRFFLTLLLCAVVSFYFAYSVSNVNQQLDIPITSINHKEL